MAALRILSGGAPQEVFKQLTPQLERETGHKADYVFAVISALRERWQPAKPADVLVMPTNILDGYQKDGVVRSEGRAVLGLVSINAVVRAAQPSRTCRRPIGSRRRSRRPRYCACDAGRNAQRHAHGQADGDSRHR